VIDLGCGSGILATAALRLGASRALALDADPEAVRAALHNGEQNEAADRLIVQLGSLAEASSGAASVGPAGLVVVNILARVVLDMLRSGLPRLVLPEGHLVLSGILEDQSASVEQALAEQRFPQVEKHTQEDWVALRAMREKT
jgi:ribosomal protein L11 methyltransferase